MSGMTWTQKQERAAADLAVIAPDARYVARRIIKHLWILLFVIPLLVGAFIIALKA
jgi:hypothetical protein